VKEERPDGLENISIIDQRRSHRTIDMVEEAKVMKWKNNRRLGRICVSISSTLEENKSTVVRI
jgi:hypothetical protein